MSKELIISRDLTVEIFDSKTTLEEIVSEVKNKVKEFKPDISTHEGRDAIDKFSRKIMKTRTGIEALGKERKEKHLKICQQIDELRRFSKTNLEALEEEARKPLTEFEKKEEERCERHESNILEIENTGKDALTNWQERSVESMQDRLAEIESERKIDWEEFKESAIFWIDKTVESLNKAIELKKNHDQEQKELAELRLQAELQRQKDYEEKIRKEAEEKAKQEAALELQRQQQKAEAEAKAAELRIQEEKQKSERAKAEYEQKLKDAEARRLAEIEEEKARIEAEEKREAEELAKREADENNRLKIKGDIMEALESLGLDNKSAVNVVTAISDGEIPHVKVIY